MNKFLSKLIRERKIEVVQPSSEICESYLGKSNNCLKSAKILLKEGIYENSIINSYYAMYDSVLALFFKCGIKCENHSGAVIVLSEGFRLEKFSKLLEESKGLRLDSQYYVSNGTSEADFAFAEKSIVFAESFVLELRAVIININNSEIDRVRERLNLQ